MTDHATDRSAEDDIAPAGASLLDWLLEAVVLFGLAYVLEPVLTGWWQGFEIAFRTSIYWLPVLLLAVHYGLASGLAAALIATALFLFGHSSEVTVGETLFAYSLRVGFEPLAWTAAAAVLGAIRTQSKEAEARLRKRLATEARTVEILAERYMRLRDRIESLERAMATGSTPALRHAGKLLGRLSALSAPACRDHLCDILTSAANGAPVTLYSLSGRKRLPIGHSNVPLAPPSDLPSAAVFPIRDGRARTLLEVHVERVDPQHFTQTDQTHFMELCDRIGSLLEQRGTDDLVRLAGAGEVA